MEAGNVGHLEIGDDIAVHDEGVIVPTNLLERECQISPVPRPQASHGFHSIRVGLLDVSIDHLQGREATT